MAELDFSSPSISKPHHFINKYKFNSTDPKFIVQLSDPTIREHMTTNWNKETLGGSTARLPIKPNKNIAMLKEVPTYVSDEELLKQIQDIFGEVSSIYRLQTAEKKYLRTVKVTFDNHNQLERALCDNVTLHGLNLKLRAEKLNINNG